MQNNCNVESDICSKFENLSTNHETRIIGIKLSVVIIETMAEVDHVMKIKNVEKVVSKKVLLQKWLLRIMFRVFHWFTNLYKGILVENNLCVMALLY